MKQSIRHAAVAGMFYPKNQDELQQSINTYLNAAKSNNMAPKAIIVPHAAYIYSGPIAASAYRLLKNFPRQIKRVLLFGPAHRMAFSGLALSQAERFSTPLGQIPIDQQATKQIEHLPQVRYLEQAHEAEHSLEVHLPFLQTVLEDFHLLPILVGDAQPADVGEIIKLLWRESDTLIVISSDLSHYHDYATAREMDHATSKAIEEYRFEDISYEHACGRNPIGGLLWFAQKNKLLIHTLDLRNSGDTAGNKDRVVGYGAYCVE